MISKLYNKYREVILYLFFGGLTTLVSMASYIIFLKLLNDRALIANVFSWFCAVNFAYFTNRIWVFHSDNHGISNIFKEIISFYGGRLATLAMEEIILFVGITCLGINNILIKLIAQIFVVIANYVISKWFVF